MNITDTIRFRQQSAILGSEGPLSFLAPVAATGLMMSIGQAIQQGKAVKQTLFLNSAFAKIKKAVMVANRDRAQPKVELETEETSALEAIFQGLRVGAISAIETVCEGLFSFIPFAIETVIVPMFTAVAWTVMSVLPLLLTPEGLIAAGVLTTGFFVYRKWREWKNKLDPSTTFSGSIPPIPLASKVAESPIDDKSALGIRNNNPGNLVFAGQPGALPKTGTFAQFKTQGAGLYNLGRQLELYDSRGINTVGSIIPVYSHTDQAAYIRNVSAALGVKPEDKLNLKDAATLVRLMNAIITQENGQNPYSQAQILEAAQQAIAFASNSYSEVTASTGQLVMPASGAVSSPFGHRGFITEGASSDHKGVDIAGVSGSSIVAAAGGVVESRRVSSSYGNFIQLKHNGFWTRYGHMSSFSVNEGDKVVQGQEIGKMGNTGVSTGSHLHFEIQPFTSSSPVDPSSYLPSLTRGSRVAAAPATPAPTVAGPGDHELINRDSRLIALNNL